MPLSLQDYIPFDDYVEPVELEKTGESKRLRSICEVLLTTAVCMIIGEYQKRLWVKGVFWGLVGADIGETTHAWVQLFFPLPLEELSGARAFVFTIPSLWLEVL